MPFASTEKRREYQKFWKRKKRAEELLSEPANSIGDELDTDRVVSESAPMSVLAELQAQLSALKEEEALYLEKIRDIAAKIIATKQDLGIRIGPYANRKREGMTPEEEVKLESELKELEALGQRYEEIVRAKRSEIVSKRVEISNAERAAQLLRDEIKSLDGPGRASAVFNVELLDEEIARKKEQAAMLIPNLEATLEQKRTQLTRLTGSSAKAEVSGRASNLLRGRMFDRIRSEERNESNLPIGWFALS